MSNYRYIEKASSGLVRISATGQQTVGLHSNDYKHLRVTTQIRHIVPFTELTSHGPTYSLCSRIEIPQGSP